MVRSRLAGGLLAMLLAWAAWQVIGNWQVRNGLSWARRQMEAGQYEPARDRLARLRALWPRHDEVAYLLGVCESALGRPLEAVSAWERVPPGSTLFGSRAIAEGRTLVRSLGRLKDAELLYRDAASRGPGSKALEARWALAELLLWQGRLDEVRRLLREIERVGTLRDRTAALREHWRLDSVIVADEEVRPVLDQAARTARGDDRVWLLLRLLATQYGRYAEARRCLDSCNPDASLTPILNRARLRWALAAGETEEAWRVLRWIPTENIDASEPHSLRAWFAARRNDPEAERSALEQLIAVEPGNTQAFDRLSALAIQAGHADRAAAFRRRQEEALRDKERYRRLMIENRDPIPRDELDERARLAERLGRWFEAQGWLRLAVERDPADRAAREALDRLAQADHAAPPLPGPVHRFSTWSANPAIPGPSRPGRRPGRRMDHPRPIRPPRSNSATMPVRPDSDSPTTMANRRNTRSPRRSAGASPSSTTTATAGSTSMPSREARFRPGPIDHRAKPATGCSATGATARSWTRPPPRASTGPVAAIHSASRRRTMTTTAAPTSSSRGSAHMSCCTTEATAHSKTTTERSGLGGPRDWPTSAAFADFDGDGDLDLYVCHYLAWDAEHPTICRDPQDAGRLVSCLPLGFPAMSDHLFRNDGGRFVDVTEAAGIVDRDGRGLGVVAADFDDDGRIDIFVANDMTANLFFRNLGGLRFEEIGHTAGVACNAEGGYQAGHGRRLRRPRRRRPAGPRRHELLRRVDDLLPQPGGRDVRR